MKIHFNLSVLNRLSKRYPLKWLLLLVTLFTLFILKICGVFSCFFHRDYFTEYTYPLEGPILKYVNQMRSGQTPDVSPINSYNFPFLLQNKSKCTNTQKNQDSIHLLIVVKSALLHKANRGAIRNTWGMENQLENIKTRTIFLVGTSTKPEIQFYLLREQDKYGDIIQSDFVDTYFNNTVKTMQGILWVSENCPGAEYILFSDDDMYVSVKNVVKFIRTAAKSNVSKKGFFGGSVFLVSPIRSQFSKWYMSLDEYPYSHYPPFINAGAFVLSKEALVELFYAAMYTKHLRFDDVFLGIAAKKVNIELSHSENFYNWKKGYSKAEYKNVIAAHGYDDPMELRRVWREQKELGYA